MSSLALAMWLFCGCVGYGLTLYTHREETGYLEMHDFVMLLGLIPMGPLSGLFLMATVGLYQNWRFFEKKRTKL